MISGSKQTKVQGLQGVHSSNKLWEINADRDLAWYMYVDWKFINLNRAFSEAVGTSSRRLMVYSNVMRHNVVGDMQHCLVREVAYKHDGSGSYYFEAQQVQWMPLGSPHVNVIEVEIAETDGTLVKFGPGRTIATLQFRQRV